MPFYISLQSYSYHCMPFEDVVNIHKPAHLLVAFSKFSSVCFLLGSAPPEVLNASIVDLLLPSIQYFW